MSTYHYIAQRQAHASVRRLCYVLCVASSAYYTWQQRGLPVPEPA